MSYGFRLIMIVMILVGIILIINGITLFPLELRTPARFISAGLYLTAFASAVLHTFFQSQRK